MTGERILQPASLSGAPVRTITTPFQFVFSGSENLRVRSASSQANVTIAIQGRLLNMDGTITPFVLTHAPNNDRTVKTQDFPLGPGTLLTLTAFAQSGTPERGQCFVQVQVIQGFGGATIALGTLLQDYVTSFQQLAWPGSPIMNALDGRGFLNRVTIPNPAAGAGAALSVPSGVRWRLQEVYIALQSSAVVATRKPYIQITVGATPLAYFQGLAGMVASTLGLFSWSTGGNGGAAAAAAGGQQITSTAIGADSYVKGGDTISLNAIDLQGTDQFFGGTATVEEWLELS